jgi:hypothetical protein
MEKSSKNRFLEKFSACVSAAALQFEEYPCRNVEFDKANLP